MSNSKYQDAKDNIVNTLARQIDYKTYKNLYSKDFDTLQELVDKTTWIPVEKKLPPMFTEVMITYEDKYLNPHINVAYINKSHEWIYPLMNNYKYRVIAWMPLPEPYLGSVR